MTTMKNKTEISRDLASSYMLQIVSFCVLYEDASDKLSESHLLLKSELDILSSERGAF